MKSASRGINKILTALLILIILFASATAYFVLLPGKPHASSSDPCGPPIEVSGKYISEYDAVNQNSSPNGIAVDSLGNVWFVLQNESALGVLYASNSTVRAFSIPAPPARGLFVSWSVVVDNTRNLVWFGDDSGANPPSQGIWSFNELTHVFKFYNFSTAFPYQLFVDKSGNVWFTENEAHMIGEIITNGTINQYMLPASLNGANVGPAGITIDNNGTIWFTVPIANAIGSLNVNGSNYSFQIYNMTGRVNYPSAIGVDSDGNVWMTEHGPSLIAEFNPHTNYFRSITTHIPAVLGSSLPYFLYIDSHGNVWFNEHQGNTIAKFSPSNDSLVEYRIPTQLVNECNISGALTMTLTPDGTPWFAEWFAGKIGIVNSQIPIDVTFSFQNSSVTNSASILSRGQSLNLDLNVVTNQSTSLTIYLSTVDFNQTLGFSYTFSPSSGNGNFVSDLSIKDQGIARGVYYLTISATTSDIIFSRIVELNATG